MCAYCFSNKKDAKLLLLGNEKILWRVDVTFSTLINYFRKLIYFSLTIPHKVVFKDFACFLGTANLRNNSLLAQTISIACMIPSERLIVPNLIFIGVVLGKRLGEIAALNLFAKPRGDKWRIYLLVKLHDEVSLTACLNKIKILIGKHFSVTLRGI